MLHRCAVAVSVLLAAAVPFAAFAADADPVAAVFAPENRALIESACAPANEAASRLAAPVRSADADDALAAEKAFIACANMRRLNPDPDRVRYVILAAATAALVEGRAAAGERRDAALSRALSLCVQVTPASAGNGVSTSLARKDGVTETTLAPTPADARLGSSNPVPPTSPQYKLETTRNALGTSPDWMLAKLAASVRDAILIERSAKADTAPR